MSGKVVRKIVRIDESRCDGCGQCVPACAEGAIRIIDGKARLIGDTYCDGLGACLGHCPQDAITIIERDADQFDPQAAPVPSPSPTAPIRQNMGCPGARSMSIDRSTGGEVPATSPGEESALGQWPVQLSLVSPAADYFQGADLLITADCVPFAYAGYHRDFLAGKAVVVGCPKLDDLASHRDKLAAIFARSKPRRITVINMEVPCCFGLLQAAREAMEQAGQSIPLRVVTVGIKGDIKT